MKYILLIILTVLIFQVSGQYKFELPEQTGYQSNYSYSDNKSFYRAYTNTNRLISYFETYNLETGKLTNFKTISGKYNLQSFCKGLDSIYYSFDIVSRKFIVINGNNKKEYLEMEDENNSSYYSMVTDMPFNPISFYNNKLFIVNAFIKAKNKKIENNPPKRFIRVLDLKTGKIFSIMGLPKMLLNHDYGMMNRFNSVRKDNFLIIAPMFSNEIMTINLDNNHVNYPVIDKKNNYFQVTEPFLKEENFTKNKYSNEKYISLMRDHMLKNKRYVSLVYDQYKHCYYRVLLEPNSKNNREYSLTLVVLDEKFQFKTAKKIGSEYKVNGMFVTKDGLNLFNYFKYKKNDQYLEFETIRVF